MTLIDRMMRLLRADLHDLLDRIEEPGVVLRQAIRDMEQELNLDQQSIRELTREEERLACRLAEVEASLQDIEAPLDVCFQSEHDDLARRLIKRRLETQSLKKQLDRKQSQIEDALARRKARFEENQARLQEIRQKAEFLVEAVPEQDFEEQARPGCDVQIRDEDVEIALLREKQSRSRS
jgi:phage shock protein A